MTWGLVILALEKFLPRPQDDHRLEYQGRVASCNRSAREANKVTLTRA